MCEPPLRSPTIVGRAVDTIVWSSAASDMPSISAPMMSRIARRDRSGRAPLPLAFPPAPLALTAAPPPEYSGVGPPAEELDMLISGSPFSFEALSNSQVAQRAGLGKPFGE